MALLGQKLLVKKLSKSISGYFKTKKERKKKSREGWGKGLSDTAAKRNKKKLFCSFPYHNTKKNNIRIYSGPSMQCKLYLRDYRFRPESGIDLGQIFKLSRPKRKGLCRYWVVQGNWYLAIFAFLDLKKLKFSEARFYVLSNLHQSNVSRHQVIMYRVV